MTLLDIFNGSDFVTRDQCGLWQDWLIDLSMLVNALTALAYFGLPVVIYVRGKLLIHELVDGHVGQWLGRSFIVFVSLFILSCGIGHVCEVLAFIWPAYRLFTLVDTMTAGLSLATLGLSIPILGILSGVGK